MSRFHVAPAAIAAVVALGVPGAARADQVDDLIAVVQKKPANLSNDQWREKRREAARELGRLGDKRAVEPLIKIVETEKFDVVAEIAIEALGKLGDKRAVPVLEKVAKDEGRDPYVREAAKSALGALGVGEPAAPAEPPPAETPGETPPAEAAPMTETPVEGGGDGDGEAADAEPLEPVPVPATSRFGADVLAERERLTFAVGSFSLTWDTLADQPQGSLAGSFAWHRSLEKPKLGYSFDAGVAVAGGAQDRNGDLPDTSSYALVLASGASTELRFYLGGPRGVFVHAGAQLGLGASAVTIEADTGEDFKEFTPSLDAGLALGAGYGRVLDTGARLRVARLEQVLRRARLLGRPINAEVAGRLMTAWWNERGALGHRRELDATVRILKDAGVLLTEPDATTVYQILRVLDDAQLDERWDGWDVRVGIGELLVGRDNVGADDEFDFERQEVALVSGRYALQLGGGQSELVAGLRGVYRLTGTPGYVALEADLGWRRFFYGEAWDPRGALELGATLAASDTNLDEADGEPDQGASASAAVRGGYRFFFARAAHLGATATMRLEAGELFVGVALDGAWGLSSASFAAW